MQTFKYGAFDWYFCEDWCLTSDLQFSCYQILPDVADCDSLERSLELRGGFVDDQGVGAVSSIEVDMNVFSLLYLLVIDEPGKDSDDYVSVIFSY